MRIVVCVKHVPDLASGRSFLPNGRVNRNPNDSVINEVDENAMEAAVQIRAQREDVEEIIALTMGPAGAAEALRRALQLGADRAVHLRDDALGGSDYLGTARALGAVITRLAGQERSVLVLMGMAALDGLGSVIPTYVAAELHWPALTMADRLDVVGDEVRARRAADGHHTELVAQLPAVVSVTDVLNTPRFPRYADIVAAREKPIAELTLADIALDPELVGVAGARVHVNLAEAAPAAADPLVIEGTDAAQRLFAELLRRGLIDPAPTSEGSAR